jgi:hypothetical protein
MKRQSSKSKEKKLMEAPNCLAIMAILTEMARCLNQNIAKVQLAPLDATFTTAGVENRPSR